MLTAGMFMCISHSKPLDTLSRTRPHQSIFTPYFFLSLLGQFAVHLGLLMYFYNAALRAMPEGERLKPDGEFKPNLVNTVCYVVEASVQVRRPLGRRGGEEIRSRPCPHVCCAKGGAWPAHTACIATS